MSASRISRGVPASKARHCVALSQWNLRNDPTTQPVLKLRRSSPEFREGSMSSKMQTRKQKSGLSRHYHEIGIKAVAAATRKESTAPPRLEPTASPRTRDSM